MPCWSLFAEQPQDYRDRVLPPDVPALFIEAGVTIGWHSYTRDAQSVAGIDRFGASAPGEVVMRHYGLSVERVCEQALAILRGHGSSY
jgi:transketolase